jgi:hypothetical protein
MPLSTDVRLPKAQEPVFPDRCVVCGQPDPVDRVEVATGSTGWWTWLLRHSGERFSVQAPACPDCVLRLTARRRRDIVLLYLFAIAAVGVATYLFGSVRGPHRKWLTIGLALAGLVPYAVWQAFFPPPIDLTAHSDTVDYEFRDRDYAEEFAALNGAKTDTSPEEPGDEEPPAE